MLCCSVWGLVGPLDKNCGKLEAVIPSQPMGQGIERWIKTECGRAKYAQLSQRRGLLARLRLAWFVVIAVLRDLVLSPISTTIRNWFRAA